MLEALPSWRLCAREQRKPRGDGCSPVLPATPACHSRCGQRPSMGCSGMWAGYPMPPMMHSPHGIGEQSRSPAVDRHPPCNRNPARSALLLPPPQFVLTTDPSVGSMADQLQYIYASLFVELVAKNPLYTPGEPFL